MFRDEDNKLQAGFLIIIAIIAVVLGTWFVKTVKKADKQAQTSIQRTIDTRKEKNK